MSPETLKISPKKQIRVQATLCTQQMQLPINVFLYGGPGSGKTHAIARLLEEGWRVLMMDTDMGVGGGLNTVKSYLNRKGCLERIENLFMVSFETTSSDDVEMFLEAPDAVIKNIWEFDPHFFVWEGGSTFQQYYLYPDVEEMVNDEYSFESYKGWGKLRNATLRAIDKFLKVVSPHRTLHKILTCHADYKSVQIGDRSEIREIAQPLLQGAAGKIAVAGFSLVIRTEESKPGEYVYHIYGERNRVAKKRFLLPAQYRADLPDLLRECAKQVNQDIMP
ncbi:MAG: hypothetical protein V2G41_09725 [bacterium JZ-2024 1]